ncbi:MAG: HD domain-containing protein, partial [Candidatus Lindowbacteria bacterium]|nr:HD domain-containing protein [Candidatus Lindowbacteria bacterium]
TIPFDSTEVYFPAHAMATAIMITTSFMMLLAIIAVRINKRTEQIEIVITSLAATVEARDPYTKGHCERISQLACTIGEKMGLSNKHVEALRLGGYLHDVGKVGVPDAVLLKPGKLSSEERILMMKHATIGHSIVKPMKSMQIVSDIVRWHHEKLDGSGYPDGLEKENIPITTQIISVVDVYDALRTERPYKKAYAIDKCHAILTEESKKGWWNPEVVRILIETTSAHSQNNLY